MKQGESISDYFSRTMSIANKMHIHGEKIKDVIIVEKILHSIQSLIILFAPLKNQMMLTSFP